MVSELAMEDIEALRADGVEVTPRDVVRLNAFGLKVERGSRSAEFHVMPRVAFLGDVAFREPTIADDLWLERVSAIYDTDHPQTLLFLRAVSLSSSELPDPTDRAALRAAVAAFCDGPCAKYTLQQLGAAVMYAVAGNSPEDFEQPAEVTDADGRERIEAPPDREHHEEPMVAGIIRDGVVMQLGDVQSLKKLTRTQLAALVVYAQEVRYREAAERSAHAAALADYLRVKDEIANRKKEPANG